jgi:hypothetical protein
VTVFFFIAIITDSVTISATDITTEHKTGQGVKMGQNYDRVNQF